MELALWIVVALLVLWNFYLHGKVQEKSIAAKTQQILRDWKLGKKEAWEAEFNGGAAIESCKIVNIKQDHDGDWAWWTCSCGQKTFTLNNRVQQKFREHVNLMKMVAK